jgi:hypothetical protein
VIEPGTLVNCPAGLNFGAIDDSVARAIQRQSGPICLPYGISGSRGFGQRHVDETPKRMAQIQGFGFQTFVAYAYFVSQQYDWITDGKSGRLVIVRARDGYDHTIVVQYNELQGHWAITTGIPKRVHRGDKLWERAQAGRSEPSPGDVENRPRRETLTLSKIDNLDTSRS